MTFTDFLDKYPIVMTTVQVQHHPGLDREWEADHFEVTLTFEARTFHLFYSQGTGHRRKNYAGKMVPVPPKLEAVISCLTMDSHGVEGTDFEGWADNYGYDPDSRSAYRTWETCKRQARQFREFLGSERYRELLAYEEE